MARKPGKKFEVRSVLLCEDVRQEAAGKQSLLGVYDEEMIVAAFPAIIARLSIRIAVRVYGPEPKMISLKVRGQRKQQSVLDFETPFTVPKTALIGGFRRYALVFALQPCIITEADTFSISLGLDGPARKVWEFTAILPRNDEERSRLSTLT